MPSSRIHVSSVTNCSPPPLLNFTSTMTASTSVASAPLTAVTRLRLPGSSSPTTAAASGSQRTIDRDTSGALDEEVEADRDDAEQQQRGVRAQEARLRRAHRGRAGA